MKDNLDPLLMLEKTINLNSRDWSADKSDAWIYGIIVGWDEALDDVAKKMNWTDSEIKQLKELNFKFKSLKNFGASSSDLKSAFHGEFFIEKEFIDENDEEQVQKHMIPWTTLKDIFKQMSQYVKERTEKDFRP